MAFELGRTRTFLVPPDIVAVQRRSPLPVRKKTPWHPRPDGEAITERAGRREWFSDHLFVEAQQGHTRTGYGTSITAHVSCAVVLMVVLIVRPQPLLVKVGRSLVMPAMMSVLPVVDAPAPASRWIEQSMPKPTPQPPAAAPAPAARLGVAAPLEAPPSIQPETGAESGINGVEGGIAVGIAGGQLDGASSSGPSRVGPLRLDGGGGSVQPPRKIKDVKPTYPQGVLSDQARGTVIIEATIGVDGRVQDIKVLQSVPLLDQAALDAVRQWEYTPSLLNGVPVAVIMTIVVKFAIQ